MGADHADLSRLAIHTQTNKPWTLRQCIDGYAEAGVGAVSVWRHLIDPAQGGVSPSEAAKMLADAGLAVPALVRGGFFPAKSPAERQAAVDENKRAVDEAQAIGAAMIVLVVGACRACRSMKHASRWLRASRPCCLMRKSATSSSPSSRCIRCTRPTKVVSVAWPRRDRCASN